MKRTVRTTMRPDQTIEVDDQEYSSLKRQGLLADEPAPTIPAAPMPPATTKKTSGGTGSKES
ncbi:hypothetical protein [Streptomyces antibioticus]|uniref:hypothetical protein n=1 Tax=Streptomyces antibioticus TaxID=1890 RepID=UPI0033D772EC